jgi:hypothetical protein
MAVDTAHHLSVHLDQPPVRVVREARVAGPLGEPADGLVVQAEVEDRVHHPGHRDRGARAHGDEERVGRVAEAPAGLLLERAQMLVDLGLEPVGQLAAGLHVRAAGVGRDREPARNRHSELRHLGQADALAAEQLTAPVGGLVEVVDETVRGHALESSHSAAVLRFRPAGGPVGEPGEGAQA